MDRTQPLANWLRLLLGLQALILVPLGAALFIAPLLTAPLWPWALTPLTARAIGAWLIAIGAGMAQSVWENDLDRVRIALIMAGRRVPRAPQGARRHRRQRRPARPGAFAAGGRFGPYAF